METSAKANENVDELFLAVAKKLEGRWDQDFFSYFFLSNQIFYSFGPSEDGDAKSSGKKKKGSKDDGKIDLNQKTTTRPKKKCLIWRHYVNNPPKQKTQKNYLNNSATNIPRNNFVLSPLSLSPQVEIWAFADGFEKCCCLFSLQEGRNGLSNV